MSNRFLGVEHPDTILAMGNLAMSYQSLGKFPDTEMLQIKVLNLRKKLLGEEHPDTFTTINHLTVTYESLGRYADAEKLQIQALDIGRLGEEHPDTINIMENLCKYILQSTKLQRCSQAHGPSCRCKEEDFGKGTCRNN